MKLLADKGRSHRAFQVGEKVYLKLQPYAQASIVNRPFPKLSFKYSGPYKILSKVGESAYKLQLPDGSQILVKWTFLPASFATWEDYEALKKRFPDAPAWGQAGSEGGGTVAPTLTMIE
ncbi:hypothetical protein QOZ80_4BG0352090 [Eleusine coracana subsp. coracana]|nr:hypothetical protein QOZ80_4BG0352090 [Eleusine coracana subsp. coracana]